MKKFGHLLPANMRDTAHLIHENRELLEADWVEGPLTLIHGDAHVGNMYFQNGRAGLLDWQVVAICQGMRDVSYFMVNSLDTDLRRTHERSLLELYATTLRDNGVKDADLAPTTLWERYRSHALYTWIATSVTAATPGL